MLKNIVCIFHNFHDVIIRTNVCSISFTNSKIICLDKDLNQVNKILDATQFKYFGFKMK